MAARGRSSVVERQLPKLNMRVRFPPPAPTLLHASASIPCHPRRPETWPIGAGGRATGRDRAAHMRHLLHAAAIRIAPLSQRTGRGKGAHCQAARRALGARPAHDGRKRSCLGDNCTSARADITRGTGRFNVSQGAIGAAQGLGAAVSATLAGFIIVRASYSTAFLTLAAIAGAGFALYLFAMPETLGFRPPGAKPSSGPQPGSATAVAPA
jgi:hypothetical protein